MHALFDLDALVLLSIVVARGFEAESCGRGVEKACFDGCEGAIHDRIDRVDDVVYERLRNGQRDALQSMILKGTQGRGRGVYSASAQ